MASDFFKRFSALSSEERLEFYRFLRNEFDADAEPTEPVRRQDGERAGRAANARRPDALGQRATLFSLLNYAPGGVQQLVDMRADLLAHAKHDRSLEALADDLRQLFEHWFNPGFLTFQRIDWSSPADLLEFLINYEAVHPVDGWSDLRRRLSTPDRRCYAYFHPAMPGNPLIFIEVALTKGLATSIDRLLAESGIAPETADTAIFYSISNCQTGLRGIGFGQHLIQLAIRAISEELPNITTCATLSPIPGFKHWLNALSDEEKAELTGSDTDLLGVLKAGDWVGDHGLANRLADLLCPLAQRYLLDTKTSDGRPVDPVARFHLGNGATFGQLNWLANPSARGMAESAGLMVNYIYIAPRRADVQPSAPKRGKISPWRTMSGLLAGQDNRSRMETDV
ncbi:malonyl-CoA decarboxylase [Sinorhizobium meliloti]|uniref:malonyl-CoA decarboxylase domain-containing protein n=1 Tax=Rhizobium meliloti TaxID=382 RepID=UPI003F16BFCF